MNRDTPAYPPGLNIVDSSNDQVTRLIESERAQIGYEIHDAILPLIFAASAGVRRLIDDAQTSPEEALSPQQRAERLEQIAGWLDDGMQTARQLLTQTHPPELADASWDQAAAGTVDQLYGESNIVQWRIDPAAARQPLSAATAAYRIVIEAIRNSLRHGQASEITVTATRQADHWSIRIHDNGRGFDPQQVSNDRFGIRAMRDRAALVGGQLSVNSRPGGPTMVEFLLPDQQPAT